MTRAKLQKVDEGRPADKRNYINQLPDELLLKVLQQLSKLPPDGSPEYESSSCNFPFRSAEAAWEPHPGLRSYPFLGQVCKHWQKVLDTREARQTVWDEVVVDFGHELITAVHTPIAWSDTRPSDEEFKLSFSKTKLDASKFLRFVAERRQSLTRVALVGSEGYYSEEGGFVALQSKHDFSMTSFGMLCGLLFDGLRELTIMRCSDFFDAESGGLETIAALPSLEALRIEDMNCLHRPESLAKLSKLTQLTEMTLTTQYHTTAWLTRLDKVPPAWCHLVSLRKLVLRGQTDLTMLPHFLLRLPLHHLDISYNKMLNFELLAHMTRLRTLSMQGLNLTEQLDYQDDSDASDGESDVDHPRMLPDLSGLKNLTALNLCENQLRSVPLMLSKLTGLRYLDMSANEKMKVPKPLQHLTGLVHLRLVDMRMIHIQRQYEYWSEAKCTTMCNVVAWQKAIKRRGGKLLLDTEF